MCVDGKFIPVARSHFWSAFDVNLHISDASILKINCTTEDGEKFENVLRSEKQ